MVDSDDNNLGFKVDLEKILRENSIKDSDMCEIIAEEILNLHKSYVNKILISIANDIFDN